MTVSNQELSHIVFSLEKITISKEVKLTISQTLGQFCFLNFREKSLSVFFFQPQIEVYKIKIIQNIQFGFRTERRIVDAIITLLKDVSMSFLNQNLKLKFRF